MSGAPTRCPLPDLPDVAYAVALLSLDAMGPARLAQQLEVGDARTAWARVRAGAANGPDTMAGHERRRMWQSAAAQVDVAAMWQRYRDGGIGVLARAGAGFPACLDEDPEPPAVLFADGRPDAIGPRRVAIVGTRRCTRYGHDLAYELGAMLADVGVTVVSGLALGIDAAAHTGALDANGAAPVAVVGTGLDRPYPRQNRELWQRVAEVGLVCGEAPLGATPERWRFPARNRIIAGLAEVVVVVESHEAGGSLYTATQALDRGRPVLAVPGPIRSPASLGCNRLLADGCHPLCEIDDVLVALGLSHVAAPSPAAVVVASEDLVALEAMGWMPVSLDQVVTAVGGRVAEVAASIERLVTAGLVHRRGPWLERTRSAAVVSGSNDPPNTTQRGALTRGTS